MIHFNDTAFTAEGYRRIQSGMEEEIFISSKFRVITFTQKKGK